MRDRVVPLNCATSIGIDGNAHRFPGLRRATHWSRFRGGSDPIATKVHEGRSRFEARNASQSGASWAAKT